jgi:hypothetical protein
VLLPPIDRLVGLLKDIWLASIMLALNSGNDPITGAYNVRSIILVL